MFYAVEILSHKKPLGVPWICGVYDARSKLPVGAQFSPAEPAAQFF